jgi:hypothetical protein
MVSKNGIVIVVDFHYTSLVFLTTHVLLLTLRPMCSGWSEFPFPAILLTSTTVITHNLML